MNKDIQEIRDLEHEYQEKWCDKVEAFMKKNFPVGTRIRKDGEVFDVTGYKISYNTPAYLICEKIIYQEKYISLYELEEMLEKKGGGQCH